MITPTSLKKGDTVAIVSTARKVLKNPSAEAEELKPALQLLEKWGLKTVLGKTIGAAENQFAGSDDLRAADFQQMMDNPKIKAIWCARGGYGTVRIIDKLDFSAFKKNPKWIIGYSDVTVLHSHIHTLGVETLHAQMCLDIENKTPETTESLRKVLFGEEYSIFSEVKTYKEANGNILRQTQHNALQEDNQSFKKSAAAEAHFQESQEDVAQKFNRLGMGKGELVGGNLSVLYSLCGSNSAVNTDGKILFIEDLDEYLYHIDRMMMNLKRNGMFKNLAGLVVGGMTKMNDNTISFGFAKDNPFGKTAVEIITETVSEYDYPVVFNFPVGHITDNRALIMGRKVTLKVNKNETNLVF
ncbi:S66 peptidase family protein [Aequorivita marina]|uniref:S66 peptidase family protein n=1 Tax=Aequorivita marina TaxID=3073654 RepID=UPI002874A34A|nr:LD-carboxypeptidase [Aequorivita sp. S2608]MDS1299035.1 LD-carboxypeptidase [Aequorivita sp. S2608]